MYLDVLHVISEIGPLSVYFRIKEGCLQRERERERERERAQALVSHDTFYKLNCTKKLKSGFRLNH